MKLEYIAIIAAVVFVVGQSYRRWLFDKLLRIQYEQHSSEWERAGSPRGYFWSPPGCNSTIWSRRRSEVLYSQWLLWSPRWIAQSPLARAILLRSRVVTLVFLLIFIPLVFIFLREMDRL